MNTRTYFLVFLGVFSIVLPAHWVLVCLYPENPVCWLSTICENRIINFLAFFFSSLVVSAMILAAVGFAFRKIRRLFFRPLIGQVLLSRGFISEEELEEALAEQRIGRVLIKNGVISPYQLDHALECQAQEKKSRAWERSCRIWDMPLRKPSRGRSGWVESDSARS